MLSTFAVQLLWNRGVAEAARAARGDTSPVMTFGACLLFVVERVTEVADVAQRPMKALDVFRVAGMSHLVSAFRRR